MQNIYQSKCSESGVTWKVCRTSTSPWCVNGCTHFSCNDFNSNAYHNKYNLFVTAVVIIPLTEKFQIRSSLNIASVKFVNVSYLLRPILLALEWINPKASRFLVQFSLKTDEMFKRTLRYPSLHFFYYFPSFILSALFHTLSFVLHLPHM